MSRRSLRGRFDEKWRLDESTGCWLWVGGTTGGGYGQIKVAGSQRLAHRVSWELSVGPIPVGLHVMHNCPCGDTSHCVNPAHLVLGTHAENMADKVRKGRCPRGAALPQTKLTEQAVRDIRAADVPQRQLAKLYGVSQKQISDIKLGRWWRHVA